MGMILNPYRFVAEVFSGVTFDGTNDYMSRGADLTGLSDGKAGTFSCWLKSGGDGALQCVMQNASTNFAVRRESNNKFRIVGFTSGAATVIDINSNNAFTTASGWSHLLASWDAAATIAQMYVNDASDLGSGGTPTNATIDYTGGGDWKIGASSTGIQKLNADVAELFFHPTYLDISNSSNRAKFISGGHPVSLGADGSLPLGVQPLIYLRGPAASFPTNLGTGGNFSVTGTLTNSATNP